MKEICMYKDKTKHIYLTKLFAARILSQHLWHKSTCPQGASSMDRGASMHTEQSEDPSSSSEGKTMPPPPLLPLWAVPPAAAVMMHPGATMGGMAADCSCGSWVVDTVVLADM